MEIKFIYADYREIESLLSELEEITQKIPVCIVKIDSHGDDVVLAYSTEPITTEVAQKAWESWILS